ncbi:MAG TPA: hypothetical protein VFR85_20190 [Anaeromyxobacteraceae bacterium]|nr:hypothetical protein [Anaeromyxobacteraceae bacterium]
MTAPPATLSPAERRLAALAAAFAPDVAGRILVRLAGGERAAAWAEALAARPRAERLDELASALGSSTGTVDPGAGRAVLDAERPALARAIRRLVTGSAPWPAGLPLVLSRAALERLHAESGDRGRALPGTSRDARIPPCCPSTCRT